MSSRMSPEALDAWQRLHTVTEALQRQLARGLRDDAGLSGAEFTVLAHLVAAGGSARPADCARSISWEPSRLTHQLGRLEARGYLERAAGSGGGRRTEVTLTAAGRAAHRAAVGPHLRAAKHWFADALDETQLHALDDALRAVEQRLATADQPTSEEDPA